MGKVSTASILRQLVKAGVIPEDAAISGRGIATWQQGALEYVTWLEKDQSGAMVPAMNVGDALLGPSMDEFGRMAVRLRSTLPGIPWPDGKTLTDEEVNYLRKVMNAQRGFLKNRRDLVDVLASESNVERDGVYAWQVRPSHTARRVQALILAEDMHDLATANRLRASLHSAATESPGSLPQLVQARTWAEEYSKKLKRKITI